MSVGRCRLLHDQWSVYLWCQKYLSHYGCAAVYIPARTTYHFVLTEEDSMLHYGTDQRPVVNLWCGCGVVSYTKPLPPTGYGSLIRVVEIQSAYGSIRIITDMNEALIH